MAAIITLRQQIYTGHGPETLITMKVKSYWTDDRVVGYTLFDERIGIIPLNNVAGIYPLKNEVN